MAHTTILPFTANAMIGDNDAQLVAGDLSAIHSIFNGRPVLLFDATDEEAALTPEVPMPAHYAGGVLSMDIHFFTIADNTNDLAMDAYVEAKTPNVDTLDMETADSWDTANSGTMSVSGTTAGDPQRLSITLTNKDGVVAGDLVRFGIRRDTDSGNDDIVGDVVVMAIEIWETT